MTGLLLPSHLLVFVVLGVPAILVLWVIPLGIVCRKAGFSPWLTLLNCVPLGNTFLLYLLALADWKRRPMFVPSPQADPDLAGRGVRETGPQIVTREV